MVLRYGFLWKKCGRFVVFKLRWRNFIKYFNVFVILEIVDFCLSIDKNKIL